MEEAKAELDVISEASEEEKEQVVVPNLLDYVIGDTHRSALAEAAPAAAAASSSRRLQKFNPPLTKTKIDMMYFLSAANEKIPLKKIGNRQTMRRN